MNVNHKGLDPRGRHSPGRRFVCICMDIRLWRLQSLEISGRLSSERKTTQVLIWEVFLPEYWILSKKFFCSNESFYLYLERKKKRCSLPSPSMVFPDEVKLCKSSVPGAEFGVCAAQPIPPGTWIGPYEGQVVRCDELREGVHNIYMWEVWGHLVLCGIYYYYYYYYYYYLRRYVDNWLAKPLKLLSAWCQSVLIKIRMRCLLSLTALAQTELERDRKKGKWWTWNVETLGIFLRVEVTELSPSFSPHRILNWGFSIVE